jgi:uncharacterized damage-inducible protein DinB
MSTIRKSLALILILAATLALPSLAEHHEGEKHEMPELTGYLADFKADFEFSNGRLIELAEAIPADKYGWSPAEGIRTVSQVFVHVAGANFFFASQFGVTMPEDFGMDAEQKITAKDDVIATLKKSQKHIYKATHKATEKDLDEKVMLFGKDRSWRAVLMIVAGHGHEHLGQAIAYARSTDVVPPWSAPQEDAAEEGGDS